MTIQTAQQVVLTINGYDWTIPLTLTVGSEKTLLIKDNTVKLLVSEIIPSREKNLDGTPVVYQYKIESDRSSWVQAGNNEEDAWQKFLARVGPHPRSQFKISKIGA